MNDKFVELVTQSGLRLSVRQAGPNDGPILTQLFPVSHEVRAFGSCRDRRGAGSRDRACGACRVSLFECGERQYRRGDIDVAITVTTH